MKKSFSLIEVLIFISILSLFFATAAAVVTISLRNMKINEHKILATRYAEELLEWLRGEKEEDWTMFVSLRTDAAETRTYCFNSQLTSNWPAVSNCQSYYGISGINPVIYKRSASLKRNGENQVDVLITVDWQEAGVNYSVPIKSTFTLWE